MPTEELWIQTAEKAKLKAYVHNPTGAQAIIMCHGFSGCSTGPLGDKLAEMLAARFLVCRFDFRGQGKSDGKFFDTCITKELEDLDAVVAFVRNKYSPKSIILLGHSFGAAIATLYAARHPIDRLISLSGEGNLEHAVPLEFSSDQLRDLKQMGETNVVNWSKNGNPDLLGNQFLEDLLSYSTKDAAQQTKIPVLLIHGAADEVIPYSASKEMHKHFGDSKLIKISDADHLYNILSPPDHLGEVVQEIFQWLEKS